MSANDNGTRTPDEFLAEMRLYTTNPNVAKALEALLEPDERPIKLEIGNAKLFAILTKS